MLFQAGLLSKFKLQYTAELGVGVSGSAYDLSFEEINYYVINLILTECWMLLMA